MVHTPQSPTGTFVNADPYDKPSLLMHIKYTCLWRIWASMVGDFYCLILLYYYWTKLRVYRRPQLFFTSISVMLVLLDKLQTDVNLGISPTMLTVLGVSGVE